jgi:hypothetical protein
MPFVAWSVDESLFKTGTNMYIIHAIHMQRRCIMSYTTVTVRLPVPVIEKYKETGKGYTTLMSEILKEASRAL